MDTKVFIDYLKLSSDKIVAIVNGAKKEYSKV